MHFTKRRSIPVGLCSQTAGQEILTPVPHMERLVRAFEDNAQYIDHGQQKTEA